MNDFSVTIEEAADTGKAVGAGLTIVSQVSKERTIQFSTAIPRDASRAEINEWVDKFSSVCERQEHRFLLNDIERSVLMDEDQLKLAQEELPAIETRAEAAWISSGKKGKFHLNENEKARQMMLANNAHKLKEDIAKKQIAIRELRDKIAKVD